MGILKTIDHSKLNMSCGFIGAYSGDSDCIAPICGYCDQVMTRSGRMLMGITNDQVILSERDYKSIPEGYATELLAEMDCHDEIMGKHKKYLVSINGIKDGYTVDPKELRAAVKRATNE